MIEVYLKSSDSNLRFPVCPPQVGKNVNVDISGERIVKKGKVNIFNGTEPDSISLACFFPAKERNYEFADVTGIDPYEYVNKLERWAKTGERLRYIVTGTPINLRVRISRLEFMEKDASGDVYYTLELKEDEDIIINEWHPPFLTKPKEHPTSGRDKDGNYWDIATPAVRNMNRAAKKTTTKVHTVKKGEYLYLLGQKYYGNGKLYKKISQNKENLKKYPKLKKSNVIYVGWKLVIP